MRGFSGKVYITPHAKERFIERRLLTNIKYNPNTNVYKKMLNMIFRSRLVKYITKEDGRLHEYREYKGVIFVCEREISASYWEKDSVTVITVELTPDNLKMLSRSGLDIRTLEIGNYMESIVL